MKESVLELLKELAECIEKKDLVEIKNVFVALNEILVSEYSDRKGRTFGKAS